MKKTTTSFFAILLLILAVSACKKDKNDPPPKVTLLMKEEYSFGAFQYTYDGSNRLLSAAYNDLADAGNNYLSTIIGYDDKNRITGINTDYARSSTNDTRESILYNGEGKIERKEIYAKTTTGETLSAQFLYTYTGDKVDVTRKNVLSGAVQNFQGYTFNAAGNAIQFRSFNAITGAAVTVADYTNFDDKKGIYTNMPKGWGDFSSKNNYGALAQTALATGAVLNRTFTYEYDADGFPTKRTTLGGTSPVVATYMYEKR
jgi:hypothetical protein